MVSRKNANTKRQQKHLRVRGKVSGTAARPRLCVYRSLAHIYAQIIDDNSGVTIVAAASNESAFTGKSGNKTAAKTVGEMIAARALEKGVSEVVFDRGGYKYHGCVKELAEGARAAGLKF